MKWQSLLGQSKLFGWEKQQEIFSQIIDDDICFPFYVCPIVYESEFFTSCWTMMDSGVRLLHHDAKLL
jgi:hypothetical protein